MMLGIALLCTKTLYKVYGVKFSVKNVTKTLYQFYGVNLSARNAKVKN